MEPIVAIDKNIPLPKKNPTSTYPFAILAVGESFLVPPNGQIPAKHAAQLNSMISYWAREGKRFAKRKRTMPVDKEEGFRIWRIA